MIQLVSRRLKSSTAVDHTARIAAAKSYLESWVGNAKDVDSLSAPRLPRDSLLVSGSSYLMATLRLEKTDTPETIASRLKDEYPITSSSRTEWKWKCPIVLDLRAWSPDGSPHYKAPKQGTLTSLVHLLDRHGIAVVGVNGTPKELEQEAIQYLGLPSLWSKQSSRENVPKYPLDGVIQMVARHQELHQIEDDENIISQETIKPPERKNSGLVEKKTNEKTSEYYLPGQTTTSVPVPEQVMSIPPISPTATIYQGSVRSGQQIASDRGKSLVILGSVNSGGEVLSDGDIFVLGKLRGRALAGLASDKARIVATSMDPELICVGGILKTVDKLEDVGVPTGTPAMVSIKDGSLVFESVSIA